MEAGNRTQEGTHTRCSGGNERSLRQTEQDDLTSQETAPSELFVFQSFVANRSAADAKALLSVWSRRFHAAETR